MGVNEDRDINWYLAARVNRTRSLMSSECGGPQWWRHFRIRYRILNGSDIDSEMTSMHDLGIDFVWFPFACQA